ncbi:carbohydate-binding domain-containing protein [Cronobacter sakazakii]|nr:carbohydate-binding domain-containing protein [Cronobacter sakazakii]ELY4531199.1 carbohydate-binding domain-containing protein [Cronobacter sakazakii]
MKKLQVSMLAGAVMGLFTGANAQASTTDSISQFGLNYTITDNQAAQHGTDCAALGADWASCNKAVITLTNPGDAVTDKNWTIWFHSIRQILSVDNDQFKVTHVMGDLHKLEPTDKFTGFPAKASVEIPIINEYWQLFITDVLPRWYVTADDGAPKVIASTDTETLTDFVSPLNDQWKRTPDDKNILMTAEARFDKNSDVKTLNAERLRGQIVPTPRHVKVHGQNVSLEKGVQLDIAALEKPAQEAIFARFALLGIKTDAGYPVRTAIASHAFSGKKAVSGAYQLHIGPKETTITGYDRAGVFYGLQSLLSLIPAEGAKQIATLDAQDAPRFDYRGIQLDVGRNFHTKAAVLRLLDQMAAYKLNKFHFHLSDDEGWRIEIPGLPELTDVGAKRCHDLSEKTCLLPQLGSGPDTNNNGSGYFTRADYIEIVKYAAARQIEVIPEVDMPAHARAAVIAMEARYDRLQKAGKTEEANQYRLLDPKDTSVTTGVQYYNRTGYLNPCLDSSRRFVDKVIGEIQQMHKEAGQPLATWHFGGDEAKNIYLGAGYTDKAKPEAGKGIIDQSRQDKPWARSPVCQKMVQDGVVADVEHFSSYFGVEVSKLVKAHGIDTMQAWQDGLKDAKDASAFATSHVNVNFWDTLYWGGFDTANDWANKGFRVVVSNPDYVYLDFPNEVNPAESGYYWGTRFSDERKIFSFAPDNLPQNAETSVDRDGNAFSAKSDKPWPGAYGLSAQLWSEVVRTDKQMEYMMYPRLLAVAERAWHRAAWEQDYQAGREYKGGETHQVDVKALHDDWTRFANLAGSRELPKLEKAGVQFRLPVPGARIHDGVLQMNVSLPGVGMEYSTDGGAHWQRYDDAKPPRVTGAVQVRSVSSDGKRYSRVDNVQP